MNIKCQECSKEFFIPDRQVKGRFEFDCNNCHHRIVIISRRERDKERQTLYRGLSGPFLTLKNLLDGIFYSFNLKNVMFSFAVHLVLLLSLVSLGYFVNLHLPFFAGRIYFSIIMASLLIVFISFIYDFHLYLLSLNVFNRINAGVNIKYGDAKEQIINDFSNVFVFSSGIFILFILLILPIAYLNTERGIIYEGSLHIILMILAFILIIVTCMKSLIYAFIANRRRGTRNIFYSLGSFLMIENLNVPVFMMFSWAISALISCLVFAFFVAVMLMVAVPVVLALVPALLPGLMSPEISNSLPALKSLTPQLFGTGGKLIAASTFAVLLFIFSYVINLIQTLNTVSIQIMKSNPGESINKNVLIISILVSTLMLSIVVSSALVAFKAMFKK